MVAWKGGLWGGRKERESRTVKIRITKHRNEEVGCKRKNWRRKKGREKKIVKE